MLSFFPRGVLDEILNLIESVSEEFPSYSSSLKLLGKYQFNFIAPARQKGGGGEENYIFVLSHVAKKATMPIRIKILKHLLLQNH